MPSRPWSSISRGRRWRQCLGAGFSIILHRRYFSPISDVPVPFFASLTRHWQTREVLLGRGTLSVTELHRKHGPFVRIAPGEVSVSHPKAPRTLLLFTLPKISLPGSGPSAGPELRNSAGPLVKEVKALTASAGYLGSPSIQERSIGLRHQ